VLLCDWRTVTVGSQNFTSYGRGSHETTALPADDLSESDFAATLRAWFDAAAPVDLTLVERMLEDLREEMKAVQDAQAALGASYEQLWQEYQQELELTRLRQLEEARRLREQAPIGFRLGAALTHVHERLARPAVWARLAEVGDWTRYR
jgi:hypothetical protein